MAISETTDSRPQHQPHPFVGLDHNLRSTADSTTSRSWQDRPSTSIHGVIKNNKPTDPSKVIRCSSSCLTTLPSDVLRAAGQHPTERVLDAHLGGLKLLFPGLNNYSDLLALGLDPVDLDLPMPTRQKSTNMTTVNRSTYGLSNGRPTHNTLNPAPVEIPSSPRRVSYQPAVVPSQPNAFHYASTPSRNFSIIISSPPKLSATKPLVFGLTKSDEESAPSTLKEPISRLQRTPASNVLDAPTARPKRNVLPMKKVNSVPAAESVQVKRGRPVNTPETAGTGNGPKKRGRKPRVPGLEIKKQIPTPIYNTFICEWKGCPAELHNLETLRNHIFHVHNKKPPFANWGCRWGKCSLAQDARNDEKQSPELLDATPVEFQTKADWQDHINNAHIVPIAWSVGDGPKVSPLGTINKPQLKTLSRWLLDEDGNQVTPSVDGQPIEKGDPEEKNGNRFKMRRDGLYVGYEPIMDPKLYWKMPSEQASSVVNGNPEHEKAEL